MANKQLDKSINLSGTIYDINAVNSDKATNDKNGNDITSYIKGLSISKKNITYTKGDGTTGTITTQDTSALVGGNGTKGLIKNGSTVTSSSGYTACPIISGIPYYKDTNSTYSLSTFGITATKEELNYVDGVTSNIQTQLNGKASSNHALSKGTDATATKSLSFGGTFTAVTDTAVNGHTITDTTTTYTMPSDRLFTTLVPTGTEIKSNANLNTTTYLKVGRYYCSANATVATLTNCPGKDAFMMQVYSPLATTIDNETTKT
jgi:hypothetical protein